MNLYIDESGSINNHNKTHCPYFVIAIVHVKDKEKLKRVFKRFVSSNFERLKDLDKDRISLKTGDVIKTGGKMFQDGKFKELKGVQLDPDMKKKFIEHFSRSQCFNVYLIKVDNSKLSDKFCTNTARSFNYLIKISVNYFISKGMLPNEECILQLDERNEKTETKYFLENYLNTELTLSGQCAGPFHVSYFDSTNNKYIQLADVYANWFYSHLMTNNYGKELEDLKKNGILKYIFSFPFPGY